jgi:hypothetical protein
MSIQMSGIITLDGGLPSFYLRGKNLEIKVCKILMSYFIMRYSSANNTAPRLIRLVSSATQLYEAQILKPCCIVI